MKPDYWEEFMHTGRLSDYLSYKSVKEVDQTSRMQQEKEAGAGKSERNDNRDGDGTVRLSDWRV